MTEIRPYTTINHRAQLDLGLSLSEYVVCDIAHHLASNPDNETRGWCHASRKRMSEMTGIPERTVKRHVTTLVEKGLLNRHENGWWVKATPKWFDATGRAKMARGVPNRPEKSAKSARKAGQNGPIQQENNETTASPTVKGSAGGKPEITEIVECFEETFGLKLTGMTRQRRAANVVLKRLDGNVDRVKACINAALIATRDKYSGINVSELAWLQDTRNWNKLLSYARNKPQEMTGKTGRISS